MHKGIVVGGPLNGAKIEASGVWDGRIAKDLTGMYRWNPLFSRWDWELYKTPPVSRRGGRPSRSKAGVPRV